MNEVILYSITRSKVIALGGLMNVFKTWDESTTRSNIFKLWKDVSLNPERYNIKRNVSDSTIYLNENENCALEFDFKSFKSHLNDYEYTVDKLSSMDDSGVALEEFYKKIDFIEKNLRETEH